MPKYLEKISPGRPFILAIGYPYYPDQVFVITEGKALEQSNLVKAVDVCYKFFLRFGHKLPMAVLFLLGICPKSFVWN